MTPEQIKELIERLQREANIKVSESPLMFTTDPAKLEAAAALSNLLEENRELKALLAPFAKEADEWGHAHDDEHRPAWASMRGEAIAEFTVGDLRRARSSLSKKENSND